MDGIVNIYKEKGFTSHDVVAKLRGILHQRKIGHTGTLDPDAEGVLPVCLGKATKLCDMLTEKTKSYRTSAKLGIVTDTQDIGGKVLSTSSVDAITKEQIVEAIQSFLGEYDQIPPMYSAKKVNGKKLYEYARQGIEIERKPERVQIHSIENIQVDMEKMEFSMEVTCSKGTYIRTLCNDIGQKLGCGATMCTLLRTVVQQFRYEEALTLSQVEKLVKEDTFAEHIVPIDSFFPAYKKVYVKEEYDKYPANGNAVKIAYLNEFEGSIAKGEKVWLYNYKQQLIGIYEHVDDEILKPSTMFFLID